MKQKDIAEERKCLFKQSANIFEEILEYNDPLDLGLDSTDPNAGSGMDSPQFLIPPVKVGTSQKEFSLLSILPKKEKNLPNFALVSNLSQKIKIKAIIILIRGYLIL